jgi:uncharacterized lipoprotein NlpE involved in copper resistance
MNKFYLFTLLAVVFFLLSCGNRSNQEVITIQPLAGKEIKNTKMTVEIWSDVVCPFCYIGKRKFETALQQFAHRDQVEIIWKSYQLNPDLKTDPSKNAIQSLAESKGISLKEARNMAQYVTDMAKSVGLTYDFEKALAVNTLNAHRFTHLAKTLRKQNEAEEGLLDAYFVLGKISMICLFYKLLGKLLVWHLTESLRFTTVKNLKMLWNGMFMSPVK